MATPFESTPKWFDAEYYLSSKLAQLQADDPKGGWTRDTMLTALNENGFTNPYDHYLSYGDGEGLSPNPLFSNDQYLAAKTAQMGSTWTAEMVLKAIQDSGLTLMQHYEMYGSAEGLSPSSAFNQNKYLEAKLDQLQVAEPDKGWTMDSLKEAFVAAGMTPLDHYLAYAKTEALDKYDYSDNGAPIPHPGNTKIVLTTGVDSVTPESEDAAFKTSDRDDVISALVSSSTKSTLNANDVIDGGKGQDTLKVDMQANFTGFKDGGVKNVENIVLENAAGRTFDAKGVEAAASYVVDGGEEGKMTIKNVDSVATSYTLKQNAGTFTAQIVDSALTGKTDTASVILNGVGSDASDVTLTVKGTSAGKVEGLALTAQGKNNYVSLTEGHETVSVAGAGNLDVTVAAGLKTFDASDSTGSVVADLHLATGLKTLNGGAGDDTITVATAALAGTVFNGGAGNDKLIFTGVTATGDKPVISGFENIVLTASGSYLNGTNVSDLQEVTVQGGNNTVTIGKLANTELTLSLEGSNTGAITYEGKGTLNLQSVDSDGSQGANTTASVIANSVDSINIVNNDHAGASGSLSITKLEAKAATELSVDTGEFGVTIGGSNTNLSSVDVLTVTGNGAFTDSGMGSFTKLTEVNAGDLKADFTYTLHSGVASLAGEGLTIVGSVTGDNKVTGTTAAEHVKFTGGNSVNTFVTGATGGKDFLELGGESFKIVNAVGATNDVADYVTVTGFDDNDVFAFGTAGTALTYTTVKTSVAANMVVGVNAGGEIDWEADIDGDAIEAYTLTVGSVAIGASSKIYLTIADDDEVAVYAVTTKSSSIAASATITAADITGIDLVGVLQGATLDTFDATSFVL